MKPLKAVSPVVPGREAMELIFAKDQRQFLPLPALAVEDGSPGRIVTRWELTEEDRQRLAAGGSIYVWITTYHQPLQPLAVTTYAPEFIDDLEETNG